MRTLVPRPHPNARTKSGSHREEQQREESHEAILHGGGCMAAERQRVSRRNGTR
jgi:hypothetical protein